MQKKLFVLLTVLTFCTTTINSKVKFGVRGGANLINMSISSDLLNADNKSGFFIGPVMKLDLPFGLAIDMAALYDQREFKGEYDDTDYPAANETTSFTARKKSADLQANIRLGVGLGDKANMFVFAGPQMAINIGDKNILRLDDFRDLTWEDSDMSINFGIGAMILDHFEVRANYNLACGRTGEVKLTELGKKTLPSAMKDAWNGKLRTNAWQIGLTLYF